MSHRSASSTHPVGAMATTAGDWATQVLLCCSPHLVHPKAVHELRVAIRRLRVAIELLGVEAGLEPAPLDAALHRMLDALGDVRDCDVLAERIAEDVGARRLRKEIARRREQAMSGAHDALAGHRADRLRHEPYRARERFHALARHAGADPKPCAIQKAVHARLRLSAARVQELASEVDLERPRTAHRLRIQLRKLRYAIELARPILRERPTQALLDRLRQVQDHLGAAHDRVVNHEQLAGLTSGPELRRLLGREQINDQEANAILRQLHSVRAPQLRISRRTRE